MTVWHRIPGYPDYEVSNTGQVRGYRKNWGRKSIEPVVLKQRPDNQGYLYVGLFPPEGKKKYLKVHRIVAMAFLPNPDAHPQVAHNDGDQLNNSLENLRWTDKWGNAADRKKHGHCIDGERNPKARLTWPDVEYIRKSKESGPTLGARFGVSRHTINQVKRGLTWPA